MMVYVFHCYEFLLLRQLDNDPGFWKHVKENASKDKGYSLKNVSPEFWFFVVTLAETKERFPSFIRKLAIQDPSYAPNPTDCILRRYMKHYEFVELHLDNIFKHGDGGTLPKELFLCQNVEVLSLRCNFLESVPPEIGRLQKLKYLALTNNRLQNYSIPFTLVFCRNLNILLLDNNLLDALPGFLLLMPMINTVHRHGNHNYFKSTFMWYHTDVHMRILTVLPVAVPSKKKLSSLKYLAAAAIIAAKINFFSGSKVPQMFIDYLCSIYLDFNLCYNCYSANAKSHSGFKVYTFKNPYLGNTCVPFLHWACSMECAEAIELPARKEQLLTAMEQDREYYSKVQEALDMGSQKSRSVFNSSCSII